MKLEINNVTKKYGSNTALSNISVEFDAGIHALIGPNGAGKTTLINIITDNLKPDSGSVTFTDDSGKTIGIYKSGEEYRKIIGFMPQYPGMYPNFSVMQFMDYMAVLKCVDKKKRRSSIESILTEVELIDIANLKIGALSGGMKQRLALAQAVLGDPEILILDEPTAGLDPKQRIVIRNYISKIAFNKIVLIATHIVPDIEFIARNIIMLKKGVIVNNAPPSELIKNIDGKVWTVPCSESDVREIQGKFRVTSITGENGKVQLKVLADEKPTEESVPAVPSLEDYYLFVFGESSAIF